MCVCPSGRVSRYYDNLILKAFLAAIFFAIFTLASLPGAMASSAPRVALAGHIPVQVKQAQLVGPASAAQTMSLTLALKWRDQQGLNDLLQRLYDPNDPLYGQYLTSAQFAARFAPTQSDYDSVVSYARSQGLTVTATTPNRLLVDVVGTVSQIEAAFGVQINNYQDSSGRLFFAPDRNPSVPANLGNLLTTIYGITNSTVAEPQNVRLDPLPLRPFVDSGPDQVGTGPNGALSPTDVRSVYNLSGLYTRTVNPLSGSGQTLALYELAVYNSSDITGYENFFGLPAVQLQNITVGNGPGPTDTGIDEVTLDIELQIALAPGINKILVYEGKNGVDNINVYNQIATDNLAKEISTSWGLYEAAWGLANATAENSIFQEMATQGQTIYAASGDNGAYADKNTLSVQDPGSQPLMTAVGGTTLNALGTGSTWNGETSWGDPAGSTGPPGALGGGGGISSFWPQPSYQQGAASMASLGSNANRNVPDVALDSNPNTGYAIFYQNNWTIYGGTSCAAPLWAAYTALVNQQRTIDSEPILGFANPTLYQIGKGARYSQDFQDIADNSTNLFYPAVTGYDLSTGWGTFNGGNLINDLTGVALPPTITASPGNAQITLTWAASSGAVSYNIYRSTTPDGEGSTPIKTGVTTTSFTDTGLINATTYYYQVTSVNAVGEGAKSNEASATPSATAASAVFVRQDTTTSGSWKGVYGGNGFNIFTDTSANNPTNPSYATVSPTGNSVFQWAAPSASNPTSDLQQAATGSTNRLAGVWYSATTFSLDLNVTDGNIHQVALYLLDFGSAGRGETVTITDAASNAILDTRTITAFGNGFYEVYNIGGHVKITFTKTAGNNCVLSAYFFDTPPAIPAAPTGLSATPGNNQVTLSWANPNGAVSYNIYRSTTSGGEGNTPIKTGVQGEPFTDTTAVNGTTYFYEVTAVNTTGESGKSNEATATPQAQKPAAPTGLTATSGNGQVGLSWNASQGATSYNVYRANSSGQETLYQSGVSTTSFTDTGVTNGQTYFYEVTAVNAGGESPRSNEASATPNPPPPAAPANLAASPGNGQIILQWTASPTAFGYNVYRGTTAGGESSTPIATNVNGTAYFDTTVANGTKFFYKVAGVNLSGTGPMSNEASATPGVQAFNSADLVVSLGKVIAGTTPDADTAYEYTTSGTLVQSVLFPQTPGDGPLHDSVLDQSGNVDGLFGTNTPNLRTGNMQTGAFSNIAITGQQLDNNVTSGGIATYLNFVYAGSRSGVDRFNMTNGTFTLTPSSFNITNVAMGLDGYLYALYNSSGSTGANAIAVYNPLTMNLVRTITLNVTQPGSPIIDSAAVDQSGNIYLLDISGLVYLCDSNGNELSFVNTGFTSFTDGLDITPSGQVVFAQSAGVVVQSTTAFGSFSSFQVAIPPRASSYSMWTHFVRNQPAPPTLTGNPGNGQAFLSWSAVNGATGYNVKRSLTSGGPYTVINTVTTGTAYTDSTVTNGTTYFYVVNAVTANGDSADSNEASVTPSQNAPPPSPTGLTATAGNQQVTLAWNASTGAISYNIYRSNSSGTETLYQSGITTTAFVDTGLTNGTPYFYEVTAVNTNGESGKSNEASATPINPASAVFVKTDTTTSGSWKGVYGSDGFNIITDTSANNPTNPSYAALTPSGNSVFQWVAPGANLPTSDLQQAATGSTNRLAGVWYSATSFSLDLNMTDGNAHQVALYLLDFGSAGRGETVTITDAVSNAVLDTRTFTNFGTGNYEVYNIGGHVKVTITKTAGNNCVLSAYFFDPKPAPPAAPTGLTATGGNGQVGLSWTASVGATSYNVYRGTSSGAETLYKSGVTNFTDANVTNGTTYYYEVTAVNTNGESGKSNEASATPQVQKPAAPTGLTATPGNNQVTLSWLSPGGETSFSIYRGTSSGAETLLQSGIPLGTTTFTDTSATNGTTYFYEVTAVNAAGESGKSNEASATPQLLPPTNLTATPGNAQVVLNWTGSPGAAGYDVYRATTSGGETLYQSNITTTTFTDTGVVNGTTYFYQVTAIGSGAQSGKSNEASATPTAVTASAVFLKQDTTTSGSWKGVYGGDGFNIITDTSANNPTNPSYAALTPSGNSVFQWVAPGTGLPTSDLQQAATGSTSRLAGVWYSATSFSIDLNLTDGNAHQVALYLLDFGNAGRGETITITDATNGNTLDTRTITGFSGGFYEVYKITGHVKIAFTKTAGNNCVVSAYFFDPPPPPPAAPTGLTATPGNGQVTLNWTASTGATSYNVYRSTASGGEGTTPIKTGVTTTSFVDTTVTNGTTYFYEVTAVNANGESGKSNEASATPSNTLATVSFVKQDTTTSGSWKGVYGADGFNILTDTSANNPTTPAYAALTPSGNSSFQWAAPAAGLPTSDLQQAATGSTNRLAGVWFSATSFSLDLNMTDGNVHQFALYLLDFGNAGRVETVTITDATTNAVLDTRSVSAFSNGVYEVYNISGHVKVTFTKTTGNNCVMSAYFYR